MTKSPCWTLRAEAHKPPDVGFSWRHQHEKTREPKLAGLVCLEAS